MCACVCVSVFVGGGGGRDVCMCAFVTNLSAEIWSIFTSHYFCIGDPALAPFILKVAKRDTCLQNSVPMFQNKCKLRFHETFLHLKKTYCASAYAYKRSKITDFKVVSLQT